jgi:hypothetical protein
MQGLWAVRRKAASQSLRARRTAARFAGGCDSGSSGAAPEAVARRLGALYQEIAARDFSVPLSRGGPPMTTFDKREEGFEKKFAHDEELRFKATARRNKHLGLWAAQKLGLAGAEAEAYAKAVVIADFDTPGEDDVFRKLRADFDAKGLRAVSDQEIRRTMDELLGKAVDEIKAGK